MTHQRLITRYPNRRLYDLSESRYITLHDIERLVRNRVDFTVVDRKSQTDITGVVLLRVLADQEHSSEPMMSREFLREAIRAHGSPQQEMLGCYLEQSAKVFAAQNREKRGGVKPTRESLTALASVVYSRWLAVQDEGHGSSVHD